MSGTDAWMPAVIAHGFYRPPRHDLSAIRTTETEQEIEAELNQAEANCPHPFLAEVFPGPFYQPRANEES
jgi:hypothetical protein